MRIIAVLVLCIAVVAGAPSNQQRIVGGAVTTIANYPSMAALLYSRTMQTYWQACGGTILNTRSILTAAQCTIGNLPGNWRVRVGSTNANSGGFVHSTAAILNHPSFNRNTLDNDVAIIRTATVIVYVNNAVQDAVIAGPNYFPADNDVVWAAGWGATRWQGPNSEQLRHVQVWVVNQAICVQRYSTIGRAVTDNMLCSGWLNFGGRDQCQGDSGGPLYHYNVVVGISSWREQCALAFFPGVNTRVSRYNVWISNNA